MFCYVMVCLENKKIGASLHRDSVPQVERSLSIGGLHEEICEPGDSDDNWHFLLSAEPDPPAVPPSGLLHVGF